MFILANAFSINMLKSDALLRFERLSEEQARAQLRGGDFVSAIGHPATAAVLSQRLGIPVPLNRISVTVEPGTLLYVAQVTMPRLAEGQVLSEKEMAEVPISYWLVAQEQ